MRLGVILRFLWGTRPIVSVVLPCGHYWLCISFLVLPILRIVNIDNIICAPHPYVQVYAAAVVENHCLVLSFGRVAVKLSSLLDLSLRCRRHLTAA